MGEADIAEARGEGEDGASGLRAVENKSADPSSDTESADASRIEVEMKSEISTVSPSTITGKNRFSFQSYGCHVFRLVTPEIYKSEGREITEFATGQTETPGNAKGSTEVPNTEPLLLSVAYKSSESKVFCWQMDPKETRRETVYEETDEAVVSNETERDKDHEETGREVAHGKTGREIGTEGREVYPGETGREAETEGRAESPEETEREVEIEGRGVPPGETGGDLETRRVETEGRGASPGETGDVVPGELEVVDDENGRDVLPEESKGKERVRENFGGEQFPFFDEEIFDLAEGEETLTELPERKETAPETSQGEETKHDEADGTQNVGEIRKGTPRNVDKGEPTGELLVFDFCMLSKLLQIWSPYFYYLILSKIYFV
jgi:hypothetical protein